MKLRHEIGFLYDLKRAKAKHVVKIIDDFEDEKNIFIILEMCQDTLFDWILAQYKTGHKVNEKDLAYIFYQIGEIFLFHTSHISIHIYILFVYFFFNSSWHT